MQTLEVNILNPKAAKLLQDLADMDLISMKPVSTEGFMDIVNRLREQAEADPLTLEEITAEVEAVRAARYASKQV